MPSGMQDDSVAECLRWSYQEVGNMVGSALLLGRRLLIILRLDYGGDSFVQI